MGLAASSDRVGLESVLGGLQSLPEGWVNLGRDFGFQSFSQTIFFLCGLQARWVWTNVSRTSHPLV